MYMCKCTVNEMDNGSDGIEINLLNHDILLCTCLIFSKVLVQSLNHNLYKMSERVIKRAYYLQGCQDSFFDISWYFQINRVKMTMPTDSHGTVISADSVAPVPHMIVEYQLCLIQQELLYSID